MEPVALPNAAAPEPGKTSASFSSRQARSSRNAVGIYYADSSEREGLTANYNQ